MHNTLLLKYVEGVTWYEGNLLIKSKVFPGAEFSVDSFFWLSGFLVTYLTVQELQKKKRVNWFLYYFHRVSIKWKLNRRFRTYALINCMYGAYHLHISMLSFSTCAYQYIYQRDPCGLDTWKWYCTWGSFIVPYSYIKVKDTCGKYWWTNILYVNNFIPSVWADQCFLWGWYLAVDMQLCIYRFSHASGVSFDSWSTSLHLSYS